MGTFVWNRLNRILLLSGRDNFFATARFGITLVAFGAFFLHGRLNFLTAIRLGV